MPGSTFRHHKHAEIGLTAIYGIGRSHGAEDLRSAPALPLDRKIKDLTDTELEKLREEIGRFTSKATCAARCR